MKLNNRKYMSKIVIGWYWGQELKLPTWSQLLPSQMPKVQAPKIPIEGFYTTGANVAPEGEKNN